jgi:hypothetical protein
MTDEAPKSTSLAVVSPRAQELLALTIYVKENILEPVLAATNAEVVARERTSERELALADKQLAREHQHVMLVAKLVGAMVFVVLGAAIALIMMGKSTEGMWLFSSVAAVAAGGGGTYGIMQSKRSDK